MRAPGLPDALTLALDELAPLADESDAATLAALRGRLAAARLRVLVVGEAKRGKSTLVNALLGRDVLPMGVTPLTAVPTTVTYGTGEGLDVAFGDGRTEHHPLSALEEFGTERGNPGNGRGVAAITVHLDAPILARGVEIVDTPGTGSVHAHNSAAADSALPSMDAAIFVLTADPPVSATERDLLGRVHELSVTTFIVLNKADYADAAGLAEAAEFTERVVSETTGQPVRLYPVSAKAALSGAGDAGFSRFCDGFTAYLDTGRTADLRRSAAGQLRRIAGAAIDEIALARRAAEMHSLDAAERVAAFTARLAAVRERGTVAGDLAAAESKRMLSALNEAAEAETARLSAELRTAISRLLAGELASASPGEIQQRGRAELVQLAVAGAEAWRQSQREKLEDGLASLDGRLTRDLTAEIAAIRDAAADLLGLELAAAGPQDRLAPDGRFFYSVSENVDQAELLAGAVRRRMPGEMGRRLARDHVLGEIGDLAERQIGRARGDLQHRLAEATRQLVLAVGRRYSGSTDRLDRALRTAAELREHTAGEAEGKLAELAGREQALRAVLARLDGAGDGQDDR
jgi:GTP-binding protein EngB required for normal cell division